MKEYCLRDIIRIKHGFAFDGEYISTDDNGVVLVTPGNFKIGGGFQENKCKFYAGEFPPEYILKPYSYIVTMTDLSKNIDTLGYSAIVPDTQRIYLHNQRIGLIEFISEVCDRKYIYYLLQSYPYQRTIANTSTGATVHHTSPSKICDYKFFAPDFNIQKKIADILSAYDDLIENNRKQIKLLEEAAQRLYKEWFVDLRFPCCEHTKIVDGVPEGWEKKPLSNIADVIMGQSPKSEFYNQMGEGLPFHQGVGSYGTRFVKDETYSTAFSKTAESGSILFSVRAPVGRLNITQNRIAIGRGIAALNHKNGFQSFLFYMLKERFFKDNLVGNGSIFASISKDELLNQQFVIPDVDTIAKYDKIAQNFDKKISALDKQTKLLVQARNRLLPKLMDKEP